MRNKRKDLISFSLSGKKKKKLIYMNQESFIKNKKKLNLLSVITIILSIIYLVIKFTARDIR